MFLHSQRDHHSKNNKRRSRVNNQSKFAYSLTSKVQEPSAFHSESSKQVPRSWITSTRLQAEISKLAWPRGSHPAHSTRVYNVLAYFYADYFDAGTPVAVDHLTEPQPSTSLKQEQRSRNREKARLFTSSKTDLLSHWTFEDYPKLSSVGHFQSEQAFTPPTHFRTLFGFSEKFGNCRPPLNINSLLKEVLCERQEKRKERKEEKSLDGSVSKTNLQRFLPDTGESRKDKTFFLKLTWNRRFAPSWDA